MSAGTHELAPSVAPAAARPGGRAASVAATLNREVLWLAVVLSYGLVILVFGGRLIAQDSWLAFLGGRLVAEDGIPRHETLTVMATGERWVDQQWLGQLFWYGVITLGGLPATLIVNAAVLLGALGIVLALARRNGASARGTALVGLACILAASPNTVVRAQVLAYPLFAGVLWLLLRDVRTRSATVLLVLPILAVWANVHGSVLVGAGLVAAYGAVELARCLRRGLGRRLAVAAALAAAPLTVLCTPYGLEIVDYYSSTIGNSAFGAVISEWQASSFPADWPFFLLAFVGVALLAREGRRVAPFELLAFGVLLVAGLIATRHIVWFALAAAAILPLAVDGVWPVRLEASRRPRVNALLLGSLTLLVVTAAGALAKTPAESLVPGFPAAAADRAAAAAGETGTVYASERFADWLIWTHPALAGRIAYDARFELLSEQEIRRIAVLKGRGPGWLATLSAYGVVVLHPRDESEAIQGLRANAGFSVAYESDDAVVFRNTAVASG